MVLHVVFGAQVARGSACAFGQGFDVHALEAREMGEDGEPAADRLSSDFAIVMDDRIHVGAEAQGIGVPVCGFRTAPCAGDAFLESLRVGADRKADPIRAAGGDVDHFRARCGHLDRNVRDLAVVEPLDPTRAAVAFDLSAVQVGTQPFEVELEVGGGRRTPPDLRHRRISPPDAEDHAPATCDLQAQRGRSGHRRITADRIRHPGSDLDPLRRGGDEHELTPDLRCQALCVRKDQAVEAQLLCHLAHAGRSGWTRKHQESHLHVHSPLANPARVRSGHSRSERPAFSRRQSRTSSRSWPKKGSPSNTVVGTPQWPAASSAF